MVLSRLRAVASAEAGQRCSQSVLTALKLRPDSPTTHVGLAYSFLLLNRSSDALRAAQTALTIDPKTFEAHYIIGLLRLESGEPEHALEQAESAIKINANFAPAYLLKSQALVLPRINYARRSRYAPTNTGSSAAGPGSGPGPDAGIGPGNAVGLGPGVGTGAWFKMVCAEAAEALETYLQLNPNPEEKRPGRSNSIVCVFRVVSPGRLWQ